MTDAEIEQLEKQAGANRSLTDQEISTLESQSAPQTQKPIYDRAAEVMFGEGPSRDMSFMDRINRVGQAGLGGAVVGAGIGGGVGAIPGAISGGGLGLVAGALGDVAEQATQAMGYGRASQVGTGMLAGGLTEPVLQAVPALGRFALTKLGGLGTNRLLRDVTPGIENDANVRQALLNARESMLSGRNPLQANTTLGGLFQDADTAASNAIKSAVGARQSAADAAIAAIQRQAEEEIAKKTASATAQNIALQQQQYLAEQAKNAASTQLRQAQEAGLGKGESLYNIGDWLRTRVLGKYVPALEKASAEYGAAAETAMNAAKQAESRGEYWAATPEALKIRDKWLSELGNREDSASNDVRKLINQIWGSKTVSKEVVDEVASAQSGMPVMKTVQETVPDFASAQKIDDIVRKLGEAYGKESVTGFDAIKTGLAKDLRKDLTHGADRQGTGGFYEWSGLGEAKTAYRDALEANAAIKNKLGDTLVAKDVDRSTFLANPEKVLKDTVSNPDSVNKLVQLVGPQDASEAISKYAIKSVEGKSPAEVQKWLADHAHLKDTPVGKEVYANVENHSRNLSGLESTVKKADEAIAGIKERIVPEDVLAKFRKDRLDAAKSQQGEITTKAKEDISNIESSLKTTGLFNIKENRIGTPSDLGEKLWSKTLSEDNLGVISQALSQNPGAAKKVFDSAAHMLSKTTPSDLPYSLGRVETILKGIGVNDPQQLGQLRTQVQNIIEASRAKKIDPSEQLRAMFHRVYRQNMPAAAGGMESTRLFDAFRKKDDERSRAY